ncbi:MAG: YjjG family noncanonical pyrimidine nucleotidase [Bacteroidota bacterium]
MKPVIKNNCPYKHVFIDLDHTLWDFERNTREIFMEIYHKYQLFDYFDGFDEFYMHYREYNDTLWQLYRDQAVDKDELIWKRFLLTLNEGGINDKKLAKTLSDEYLEISPTKRKLFPHAKFALTYLNKQYKLSLITNGFKEVQYKKIRNSGLDKFFKNVFTSEELNAQKPEITYFEKVLKLSGAKKENAVVIGDDIMVDIMGAANAGIDQIWFNPDDNEPLEIDIDENIPTQQFSKWKEIIHIL